MTDRNAAGRFGARCQTRRQPVIREAWTGVKLCVLRFTSDP
jgi:hypothetical protein